MKFYTIGYGGRVPADFAADNPFDKPDPFTSKGLTPLEDKTITLAFPPGKGTLVVLSVSLTDN